MNTIFTYNQEEAAQIGGGGQYVTESGGYDLQVERAQFKDGKFLEFDFKTRDGKLLNYVSINYVKNDGQPNQYGQQMIQAIMGCIGVQSLSVADNEGNVPELKGKQLKGVVQRVNYIKQSGEKAGQEGYKFDFKLPANIQTGKTVKEQIDNKPAEAFAKYAETITDKDDTQRGGAQGGDYSESQHSAPQYDDLPDFDDDIPF